VQVPQLDGWLGYTFFTLPRSKVPTLANLPDWCDIHAVCLPHFLREVLVANGCGILLNCMPLAMVYGQR
jgi:hypothetical protein